MLSAAGQADSFAWKKYIIAGRYYLTILDFISKQIYDVANAADLDTAGRMYKDILHELKRIELSPQEGDEKFANPSLSEELAGKVIYNREELALVPEDVREKLKSLKYRYMSDPSGYDWYEIYGPYEDESRWFGLMKKKLLLELVMDGLREAAERQSRWEKGRENSRFGDFAESWLKTLTEDEITENLEILQHDILPFIGAYGIFRVRDQDLEACLTRITDRGDYKRAEKALQMIRDIYEFADNSWRIQCPLPEDYVIITTETDQETRDRLRSVFLSRIPQKDYTPEENEVWLAIMRALKALKKPGPPAAGPAEPAADIT